MGELSGDRWSEKRIRFAPEIWSVALYLYDRYDGIRWQNHKRDRPPRLSAFCLHSLVHVPSPFTTTMKVPVQDSTPDRKGHVCPPSSAKHPSDRWESLFVYGFICRFTQLRVKVEGFNSPMEYVPLHSSCLKTVSYHKWRGCSSFEDALLSPEPNLIMTQILSRFVLNLRPGTRNLRCARFLYATVLVKHVLLMYCVLQL